MKKDYDQMDTWSIRKNEPKTNPIEPKTNPILANKTPIRTQFKPKQTQFVVGLPALPVLNTAEGSAAEGSNLFQKQFRSQNNAAAYTD
jgi:hypothetical protein